MGEALSGQIYLGGEAFLQRMRAYAAAPDAQEIPRTRRRPVARSLQWYFKQHDRDSAIARACLERDYTQSAIAAFTGLSVSRVSRLIKRKEAKGKTGPKCIVADLSHPACAAT